MTDNGSAYISRDFQAACRDTGLKHLRTRPYSPRTNGKAERFIQTVLRECAYARPFSSSQDRADALPRWTHLYNVHRPHTALTGKPPISRLDRNNLLGNDRCVLPRRGTSVNIARTLVAASCRVGVARNCRQRL
jgi:transposase InsO family protein